MIKLELQYNTWIADYSESSNREEILDLFGTLHLPTAYTAKTSAQAVLNAIKILNDEAVVLA